MISRDRGFTGPDHLLDNVETGVRFDIANGMVYCDRRLDGDS